MNEKLIELLFLVKKAENIIQGMMIEAVEKKVITKQQYSDIVGK